jgi:hypothetical protein
MALGRAAELSRWPAIVLIETHLADTEHAVV